MTTSLTTKATRLPKGCTYTNLGARLRDYVLDLLDDVAAQEVEDHLLECRHCRDRYLKALNVLGMEDGLEPEPGESDTFMSQRARVLRIADFKRR